MLTAFDRIWHLPNQCLLWALLLFNTSDRIIPEHRDGAMLGEFYYYRFSDFQSSWSSSEQEKDVGATEMLLHKPVGA